MNDQANEQFSPEALRDRLEWTARQTNPPTGSGAEFTAERELSQLRKRIAWRRNLTGLMFSLVVVVVVAGLVVAAAFIPSWERKPATTQSDTLRLDPVTGVNCLTSFADAAAQPLSVAGFTLADFSVDEDRSLSGSVRGPEPLSMIPGYAPVGAEESFDENRIFLSLNVESLHALWYPLDGRPTVGGSVPFATPTPMWLSGVEYDDKDGFAYVSNDIVGGAGPGSFRRCVSADDPASEQVAANGPGAGYYLVIGYLPVLVCDPQGDSHHQLLYSYDAAIVAVDGEQAVVERLIPRNTPALASNGFDADGA